MYISTLNSATIFGSEVVYEASKEPITSYEKNYIDRFEEGEAWDAKFLGEGVSSKAYYSSLNDFVIKQNKPNPYIAEKKRSAMGSLAYKNDILLKIDPSVKTTQRGKVYVETAKGGKFLISSFKNLFIK